MLESYDIRRSDRVCQVENAEYFSNRPTYINETQLLFFNNNIINLYHRPEFNYNQTMRCIISRSDNQLNRDKDARRVEAAIIIQRAYRFFCLRRQTKHLRDSSRFTSHNYLKFWDKCKKNGCTGSLLTTASNSALECKIVDSEYDSIPFESPFPTPPDSPILLRRNQNFLKNNRQRYHFHQQRQQHHSQCPLSKQRNQSVDLGKLGQYSPHAVIIYEEDLKKINQNLYVVHSCDKQPLVMTINSNCPTHKVYHNSINTKFCSYNSTKISDISSQGLSITDCNLSQSLKSKEQRNVEKNETQAIESQTFKSIKRRHRIGLNIFNKNPAAGINYLIQYQYIKANPSNIARFLLIKSGLSRSAVGDYIGSISDPMALQVTKFFLRRINMKNKEVDEALRSFIYYVHLPGESQKICHLMEEFKEAYILQNESRLQFKSTDTIMVLAYAIIMLQTDAHNQSIRKSEKMTLEQFVNNLRGVDDNCDIDRQKLELIYMRVTGKEIKTLPDHSDQVRRLNEVLCGSNKPVDLVNRIRRFICYCRLTEIKDDGKKNKCDAHQREVFLFNDILLISKLHNKSRKDDIHYQCKRTIALIDLRVKSFGTPTSQFGIQLFDRKTSELLIKLSAQCAQDQKRFIFDLSDCILESLEMDTINYSDFLSLSPSRNGSTDNISPSQIKSNISNNPMKMRDYSIPNPPRRLESLIRMGGPDVVQTMYRSRKQSLTENEINCLKTCPGKLSFY